ncbi:MAG: hypothetical protein DLM59_14725 [Pseudonocardiales bacterium]|nr:MAG: hypothetical protein DLM59_14725 [Pseudonocardiales bacterium]
MTSSTPPPAASPKRPSLSCCVLRWKPALPVCASLDELHAQLTRQRRDLAAAAATVGARIVASGTWPADAPPVPPTATERYQDLVGAVGPAAHRPVCGCHVHVQVDDPDLRVAVICRVRPWLPIPGVGPLADRRAGSGARVQGGVRRPGRRPAGHRGAAGQGDALLGHPRLGAL